MRAGGGPPSPLGPSCPFCLGAGLSAQDLVSGMPASPSSCSDAILWEFAVPCTIFLGNALTTHKLFSEADQSKSLSLIIPLKDGVLKIFDKIHGPDTNTEVQLSKLAIQCILGC